jgi:ABC-2 type transport system permease protein
MKKSWAICVMEIGRLLKKPQSYILMFAMPLLFTLIFGSFIGDGEEGKMKLLLVDEDHTTLSKSLFQELKDANTLFELEKTSMEKANQMLESKEIPGAIVINSGFEDELLHNGEILVHFQKNPELSSSAIIREFVANKLAKMKIEVKASSQWSQYSGEEWEVMYSNMETQTNGRLKVNQVNIDKKDSAPQMNGITARASGFAIMFVMIMMMSVTGTILEARKTGVWYRLLATPASRFEISFGYLLSFFLIGWIQFGVLMITTKLLLDVYWGDPFSIIMLVSAMLLAIVGLGLFIAGLVKTIEQQASIGNLIVVASCMISGVYWPIEIQPVFMQKMAEFFPQRWAMKGFTEIIANGGNFLDIMDSIAVLIGFAVLFLVVGLRKIRFE